MVGNHPVLHRDLCVPVRIPLVELTEEICLRLKPRQECVVVPRYRQHVIPHVTLSYSLFSNHVRRPEAKETTEFRSPPWREFKRHIHSSGPPVLVLWVLTVKDERDTDISRHPERSGKNTDVLSPGDVANKLQSESVELCRDRFIR